MVPRLGSSEHWCDVRDLHWTFHACIGRQMDNRNQMYTGGCMAKAVRPVLLYNMNTLIR